MIIKHRFLVYTLSFQGIFLLHYLCIINYCCIEITIVLLCCVWCHSML